MDRGNGRATKIILLAITGLILLGWLAWRSRFRSVLVCIDNGEERRVTEWQLPFTWRTYWTTQSDFSTPVSSAIARDGLAVSSERRWELAQGSGNGVGCALGVGSHLWPTVHMKFVADFLDTAVRCGHREFAREWVKLLLDPDYSSDAFGAIQLAGLPAEGLNSQADFDRWWAGEPEYVMDCLKDVPAAMRPRGLGVSGPTTAPELR